MLLTSCTEAGGSKMMPLDEKNVNEKRKREEKNKKKMSK